MTDRKQALKQLLAKIEAGDGDATFVEFLQCFDRDTFNALNAYGGSLDAAKSLHDAVLPESPAIIYMNGYARVEHPTSRLLDFDATSVTPARAWLIAIIKALIAEGGK